MREARLARLEQPGGILRDAGGRNVCAFRPLSRVPRVLMRIAKKLQKFQYFFGSACKIAKPCYIIISNPTAGTLIRKRIRDCVSYETAARPRGR